MAKVKTYNNLVYILYLFLFLSFLAGIYVCFSYGLKEWKPTPTPLPTVTLRPKPILIPTSTPVIIKKKVNRSSITLNSVKQSIKSPAADPKTCPNLLVRRGNQLFMYNQNAPEEPGVNPVIFNNLDDYIYYVKVQRYNYGNDCPVLYLQEENDTQGNNVYRVRPGPFDTQGGTQVTQGFPDGMVLPQLPVTYSTDAVFPPNYIAANLGNTGGNAIPLNNIYTSIVPTPEVNLTGSMPTTFPSNLQSSQMIDPNTGLAPILTGGSPVSTPNNGFYTGSSPMPVSNASGPSAFNQLSAPAIHQYVDASRENPPFNQNQYAGFDPTEQYTGKMTNLDVIHNSTIFQNPGNGLSDNPMDPNWGGVQFTRAQVNSGKYDDNVVTKPVYSGAPNVVMNPDSLIPLVKPIPNNPIIAQDTKLKKSSPENA